MLELAIRACRKHGKYVGICGQGLRIIPDLARWLMERGIDSLSLNPGYGRVDVACAGRGRSLRARAQLSAGVAAVAFPAAIRVFSRRPRLSCLSLPRARPICSLMRPFV
jgi:hypothetical protein